MGLTIHYGIEASQDWTRRQIRQKLEDTRRFALASGVRRRLVPPNDGLLVPNRRAPRFARRQ